MIDSDEPERVIGCGRGVRTPWIDNVAAGCCSGITHDTVNGRIVEVYALAIGFHRHDFHVAVRMILKQFFDVKIEAIDIAARAIDGEGVVAIGRDIHVIALLEGPTRIEEMQATLITLDLRTAGLQCELIALVNPKFVLVVIELLAKPEVRERTAVVIGLIRQNAQ